MGNKKDVGKWALIILGILVFLVAYTCLTKHYKPSAAYDTDNCAQEAHVIAKDNHEIFMGLAEAGGHELKDEIKSREYDREKYLEIERQCSDLKAQWAMADVTWYAFMAGILGIGLVFITLAYTARASRSDAKARRAWVWLDTIEARHNTNQSDILTSIDFNPLIRNSGETPAKNVSAICNLAVKPTIEEAISEIKNSERRAGRFNMFVAPKTPSPLSGSNMSRSDIESVKSRQSVAVFWMLIRYNDLFDPNIERVTEVYRELKIRGSDTETGITTRHQSIIDHPDTST